MHFPGDEEWFPVDEWAETVQVIGFKHFGAGKCGCCCGMIFPVNRHFILQCFAVREIGFYHFLVIEPFFQFDIFFFNTLEKIRFLLFAQQGTGNGHASGCIQYMHYAFLVFRCNFNGGMNTGCSGTTNEQGLCHAPAFHFFGDMNHLVQ